jgi:hypothetical protein
MKRSLPGALLAVVVVLCLTGAAASVLPKKAASALAKKYPGWREMKPAEFDESVNKSVQARFGKSAVPQRIQGDFDGNKKLDFALLIRKSNDIKLVVLRQLPRDKWDIREHMGTYTGGLQGGMSKYTFYITLRRPGAIAYWQEGKGKSGQLKLMNEAIELNDYGKASMLYYWDGKGFSKVQTAD